MSSVEQVRKVLDEYFVYTNEGHKANCAKRIHALYERGGGAEQVVQDLASVIMRFDGRVASPFDLAAAILRAIDARVGAKGAETDGPDTHYRDAWFMAWNTMVQVNDGFQNGSPPEAMCAAIRALADAKATEYALGFDDGAKEAAAPITEAQAIAALQERGWMMRRVIRAVDGVHVGNYLEQTVTP